MALLTSSACASRPSDFQKKPSCLIVNDIDAGLGRLQGAQVTVNNQTCQGTLMNLCDNPNEV